MNKKLKILHLEDLATDAELVKRTLKKGDLDFEIHWVKDKGDFIKALRNYQADIILSDHSLPSMNSQDALLLIKEYAITVPLILVTATISEEYAVEIMKLGAYDYVLKDRLQRLPRAIEIAMTKWYDEREKERYLIELVTNERKFRGLIENGNDLIMVWDEQLNITYRSPSYERISGWELTELYVTYNPNIIHPEDQAYLQGKFEYVKENSGIVVPVNFRAQHKNGKYQWLEGTLINLLQDSSVRGIVSNFRDVTEKKEAEEQLQQSRYLLAQATEVAHIGYFTVDAKHMKGYWSDEVCRIYGIEPGSFDGSSQTFINFIYEKDRDWVLKKVQSAMEGKAPYVLDHRIIRPDGAIRWVHHSGEVSFSENGEPQKIIGITQDVTEQKTLEEMLREYNERFEIVSKATNDAIWDWDIINDAETWNHGMQSIFGYKEREIGSSKSWWKEKIKAEDYDRVQKELEETFKEKATNWISQYQFLCADRSYKYVLDRAYIVYKEDKPIRMIGAMQDITIQRMAAEEIEKLSLVASKTSNSVIITDSYGKMEWVNQAFTDLTEYTLVEAKGQKPGALLQGPETDKATIERIRAKLRNQEGITEEILNYSKGKQKFWIRLSIAPVFDVNHKIKQFIAVMSNITEQKEFELKITSTARELSGLIENANVPIFGVDRNGCINEWNKITAKISSYTNEEVMGKKWINLLERFIHDKVIEVLDQVFQGKPMSNYELPFTDKNGKLLILLISISPRRDLNNNIIGALCVGQDLTEVTHYRRGLEKLVEERTVELNNALNKEKELVEMKSKFISIASHEFRTPLSTIALATGFIKKYYKQISSDDLEEKLMSIEKQVSHMAYLLDDVLMIGKAEAGKIEVIPSKINVGFFKKLAEEVIRSAGTQHNLQYSQDCNAASVTTSEKLIRNIIINLLTNAIKFSPDKKDVFMDVTCDRKSIYITVKDRGIGIPSKDIKNLFTSFSRGSNVGNIEGTGLGLSIVKKAVDLLKGTVSVKSKIGAGTEFKVTIPLDYV
jgi:PAS domain S-box-containing protein